MKKRFPCLLVWTALFALFATALRAAAPGVIAIRNARIVTVSGPVLPRGTVVVRDGLIEAAGDSVQPPPGAWIIEGDGLTVYAGLISALSTWGIPSAAPPPPPRRGTQAAASPQPSPGAPGPPTARGPDDRPLATSWLHAANLVTKDDPRMEAARSAGLTASLTFPTRGIFPGRGAVVNLAGESSREMVVVASAPPLPHSFH